MQESHHSEINPDRLREIIDGGSRAAGFDAAGVAAYELLGDNTRRLEEWISRGMHADMVYMERSAALRGDLETLLPGVRSVVVTLTSYIDTPAQTPGTPVIARFARGEDYHKVIKSRLRALLGMIRAEYPQIKGRAVVDSAPTFEREWAVRAGLGWIGRSSMLVNPELGSFTLIGLLLLDHPATPSKPFAGDLCGECRRCMEYCPTGAITGDRTVDSRRCLSYQTIERRNEVEPELAPSLAGRIAGCDVCMEVCPYNSAAAIDVAAGLPGEKFDPPTAREWFAMSGREFDERFGNTPLNRAGLDKIRSTLRAAGYAPEPERS